MNFLNLSTLILLVPAFIVGIAVHEASHALAATVLGDEGPRRDGRLSLNPLRHLDPLGTVALFIAGFGWGKPVMVQPWQFRINRVTGMALVAFAGPASNIVAAAVFSLPLRLNWELPTLAMVVLLTIARVNLILAVFNLIPIPPLDGFSVLMGLIPKNASQAVMPLAQYGPGLLMVLFLLSYLRLDMFGVRLDLFGMLIGPPFNALRPLVIGV